MKQTNKLKLKLIGLFMIVLGYTNAQTFNCYISNNHYVSTGTYDFDVSISNTSGSDFLLRTVQCCFTFSSAFTNGATISASYVASSTEMINYSPGTITYSAAASGFQVAANTGAACANGTIIPASGTAVRIATFRLTAISGSFGCHSSNPNMVINGDPAPSGLPLRMAITKWNDNTCTLGTNSTITGVANQYTRYALLTQYSLVSDYFGPHIVNLFPASTSTCSGLGSSAKFTVSAFGNGTALSYQWYENNVLLSNGGGVNATYSGAQSDTLQITNPTIALNGSIYRCDVMQCTPSVIASSNNATLNVTQGPICQNGGTVNQSCGCNCPPGYTGTLCETIACTSPTISCPGNQTANAAGVNCNAVVTYTDTTTGTAPVNITYSFAGVTTGSGTGNGSGSTFNKGATTVTLTATNVCGSQSCSFDVVVTDVTPPTITAGGPTTFCSGTTPLTLTANSGTGYTYLWKKNGVNISEATNISYQPTSTGAYKVVVTSTIGCTGTASSATVNVTVNTSPTALIIAGGPTAFCTGDSVKLFSSGDAGKAIKFDGVDDQINITANAAFDFTAGTVELFVYPGVSNFNKCLVALRSGLNTRWSTHLNETGNNIGIWNGSSFNTIPVNINPNVWYHIAFVMSTANVAVYVNGSFVGNTNNGINTGVSGVPLIIGNSNDPGLTSEFYNGSIDEVRIWNVARTATQIKSNMNIYVPTNSAGLVAYYKMNEGSGNTTADATGNNNTATLVNGPTWKSPSGAPQGTAYTGYLWSDGSTTRNIVAKTSGTYLFTATAGNGCTKSSAGVIVTARALPSASFTASGSLTFCAGDSVTFTANSGTGLTYQWQKGGVNISGANAITYKAKVGGVYRVIVTNVNGCTKASATKTVVINCRLANEQANLLNLSVYPNPSSDLITCTFDCKELTAQMQLINATGQILMQRDFISEDGIFEEQIDISSYAPGVYLMLVKTSDKLSTARFVKE